LGCAARLRKRAEELGSTKAAAIEMARREGLSVGRLQNIAAESKSRRLKLPRWLQRWPWNRKIESALDDAARRLERSQK
jgi:hypothetical protein